VLSPDFYLIVYIQTSRIKIGKVLVIKGGSAAIDANADFGINEVLD